MEIAVLGLGIIGAVWARHWQSDGHRVRSWNRTPRPGAPGFAADPLAAVSGADLVAVVVADPPAVREVLGRVAPALKPGAVVAQHSTVGADDTREFRDAVRRAGARFLDLPFTGSKPAAEARQVVYYAGDDDGSLALVEAAYRPLSRAILPVGGVGQATVLKLAMNLQIASVYQALAESFLLAGKAGIPPETYFKALDLNVARSGVSDLKRDKLARRDWSTQFAVRHMRKDLRLALRLAAAAGVVLPQAALLERAYAHAEALGLSGQDFSALAETLDR